MNVRTLHKRMEKMARDPLQEDREGDRTIVPELVSGLIAEIGLHAEPFRELLTRISSEECLCSPAVYATWMLASAITDGKMLRTPELAHFFSVISLDAYRSTSNGEIEKLVQLVLEKHVGTFEDWVDDCSEDDTETLGSLFTIVTLSSSLRRKHQSLLVRTLAETDVLSQGDDLESAEWLLCVLRSQFGQRSCSAEDIANTSFEVRDQQRAATKWVSALIAGLGDWKCVSTHLMGEIASGIGCTPGWSRELFDLEMRTCIRLLCKLLTHPELDSRLAFRLATMAICREIGYDPNLVSIEHHHQDVRIRWSTGRSPKPPMKLEYSVELTSALQSCEPLKMISSNFSKLFKIDLNN